MEKRKEETLWKVYLPEGRLVLFQLHCQYEKTEKQKVKSCTASTRPKLFLLLSILSAVAACSFPPSLFISLYVFPTSLSFFLYLQYISVSLKSLSIDFWSLNCSIK